MRPRLCLLWLCALLAAGAVGAPPALSTGLSTGNSFSELSSGQPETPTATTPATAATSSASNTGTSKTLILGAAGAAVVLLSGIAFVIVRDARRVAPASDLDLVEARSSHDTAVRLAKRRAKAKAARQQRKRTRRA